MSSRQLVRPFFPGAPKEYNQAHQADIQRQFALFIRQIQNPGDSRATTLTLTNLQSGNDQGLATGDVYEKDGFLKITLANAPNVANVSGITALGTVTVTTT